MTWKFPIDPKKDYRQSEDSLIYAVRAYAEAMYSTEELHQQLRLMDFCCDNIEQKLWLAFLWGACYNLPGPFMVMQEFPTPPRDISEFKQFSKWYNSVFDDYCVDTDCRYRKAKMVDCVLSYVNFLQGRNQQDALPGSFRSLWGTANNNFYTFGRLALWNYLEAVYLVKGFDPKLDSPSFLLDDKGSESNRNGVAYVYGKKELVTKKDRLKSGEKIPKRQCLVLEKIARQFFQKQLKDYGRDKVSVLNTETVFCWSKKMISRPRDSRYFGWDGDRTFEEIVYLEGLGYDLTAIREAQAHYLPPYMLNNPVDKKKMAVFHNTGKLPDIYHHQISYE